MTRLFVGSLIGGLGASMFTASVMEDIPYLFGLSASLAFVGFGILVRTDRA